jgi:hypothetical protein
MSTSGLQNRTEQSISNAPLIPLFTKVGGYGFLPLDKGRCHEVTESLLLCSLQLLVFSYKLLVNAIPLWQKL